MIERNYQPKLIKKLKALFPGIFVLKTNPTQIQGIPDLVLLYFGRWAVLETKRSKLASYRPNQPFYINLLNNMGFASRIDPDNEEDVIDRLKLHFDAGAKEWDLVQARRSKGSDWN